MGIGNVAQSEAGRPLVLPHTLCEVEVHSCTQPVPLRSLRLYPLGASQVSCEVFLLSPSFPSSF